MRGQTREGFRLLVEVTYLVKVGDGLWGDCELDDFNESNVDE